MARVATMKRHVTLPVRELLRYRFWRMIGHQCSPGGAQSVLAPGLPATAEAADSADRDSSEHLGAVKGTVSEAISAGAESDPDGVTSDPWVAMPDTAIQMDSAAGPVKRIQDRRRKQRKTLPEPPIPTFIMVSPGRYIRAEEPSPSSNATARRGSEEDLAPETQAPDACCIMPAGEPIPDMAEGHAERGFGSLVSSSGDAEGITRIDDAPTDGPSSDAQEAERTGGVPEQGVV
jgi:hypothetical protein